VLHEGDGAEAQGHQVPARDQDVRQPLASPLDSLVREEQERGDHTEGDDAVLKSGGLGRERDERPCDARDDQNGTDRDDEVVVGVLTAPGGNRVARREAQDVEHDVEHGGTFHRVDGSECMRWSCCLVNKRSFILAH